MSKEEELIKKLKDVVCDWAENWSPIEAFDYMEKVEALLYPVAKS